MKPSTYLIKSAQIEKVFNMSEYVTAVEQAFVSYAENNVQMPPKVYLSFEKGDLRCMPAYLPSMNIAGVKNVNVHTANKEIPTVMATITLFDPDTGFPLAIMDGTYITKMRTGAASAVAAKYLAKEDSKTVAFIGTGIQAIPQLKGLLITKPDIKRVAAFDIMKEKAKNFLNQVKTDYDLDVEYASSVRDAVKKADIVVTITPAKEPIVLAEHICPGTHINAIGADAEGKQELDPQILKNAKIVIDNWQQASHSGEINVALSKSIIDKNDIYANIGEIVTRQKPGRESTEEITVFDSTGLAIQDIYPACQIYRKLISDQQTETCLEKFDFL